jgi:hypothetical protein
MSKSRKQPLISYAEYRLREAYDEDQEQAEDDWSFEEPKLSEENEESPVEHWEGENWGGHRPEWWEQQGPEEDTLVKPSQNDMLRWGEMPAGRSDTGYYIKTRPTPGQVDTGPGQASNDLGTLGMSQHPTFAQMPERGNELAAAGGPGPDEDPEDWQAKQDLEEVSGVYGLKLGSTKSGNLVIQKAGLSSWRQDFPDYVSAMQWIKQNMGKVSSR